MSEHFTKSYRSRVGNLRLFLPALNVLVALGLLSWSWVQPFIQHRPTTTAVQIAYAISAPACIIRSFATRVFDKGMMAALEASSSGHSERTYNFWYLTERVVDDVFFLVAVWLIWYGVAREIELFKSKLLSDRSQLPRRLAVDMIAIVFGALLILVSTGGVGRLFEPSVRTVLLSLWYLWGPVICVWFAADAVRQIGQRRSAKPARNVT